MDPSLRLSTTAMHRTRSEDLLGPIPSKWSAVFSLRWLTLVKGAVPDAALLVGRLAQECRIPSRMPSPS